MLKKHTLFTLGLLCSAPAFAVQIESRGLSQQDNNYGNAPAINISNTNPADTAITPTNINWQLLQKIERLEADMRSLRGKIEEQDNEINLLKSDAQNRYTDLDQRLQLLTEKVDPESVTNAEEDNQQDTAPSSSSVAKTAENKVTSTDEAAYTVALQAYKAGGAKKALAPMQDFIKTHPNSPYISNAHYWLAEFYLGIDPANYTEAKKNYEIVSQTYPNSAKAASAIYRLYSIALNVDQNSVQANLYKNMLLQKYPKSEEAEFVRK